MQRLRELNIPRLDPPTRREGEPEGEPNTWTREIRVRTTEGTIVSFVILDVYKIVPWRVSADLSETMSEA